MARKRVKKGATKKARPLNRNDSKLKRWNKLSDIPLDEEDQFHASRDKILLEGDGHGDDDEDEDDEVFALQGMSEDDEDEPEDGRDDDEEDSDGMDIDANTFPKPTKKKKPPNAGVKGNAALYSSSDAESSEEETWGRKKSAYYSSNAAEIESDDEEANELEEEEAKRLQSKFRETLTDNDFGLDDPLEVAVDKIDLGDEVTDSPALQPSSQGKKSIIWELEENETEAMAIKRDWEDTSRVLAKCRHQISKSDPKTADSPSLGLIHLYYQALLTYAALLAFYLHLSSCEKYVQHPDLLKAHPVSSRILTLKQHLITFDDLDLLADELDEADNEGDMITTDIVDDMPAARKQGTRDQAEGKGSGKQVSLRPANPTEEQDEPPKKKRKTILKHNPLPVFDLIEPEFVPSKSPHTVAEPTMTDAFGELTSLEFTDAADKKARRKSLRFHTNKIESASARRQGARSNALGGDDDLPYRERLKERDIRLAKEAKARRGQGGEDLDDIDPEMSLREGSGRFDDSSDEDGPDGYYELVQRQSRERKEKKKAEHDLARAAIRFDPEEEDISGPRGITRAIMTNKGLTPRRAKAVRNPRVKKRLRFEKAKKKVSSQMPVYKGGIGDTGRYEGERSGISKVVKSIPLG